MITLHVSLNDATAYNSVNEALISVKDSSEPVTIHIASGIYEEKVFLRRNNVRLIGQDPLNTILTWHHGAKSLGPNQEPMGTFNSFSVIFCGADLCVENLTIQNTSGPGSVNGQAVAAFITSDRASFYNCRFIGYQDTIYSGEMTAEFLGRIYAPEWFLDSDVDVIHEQGQNYFENCYVEGDVDYIFGSNLAYFNQCHVHTIPLQSEGHESYITAPNTSASATFGFIFNNCQITGEDLEGVYLGRPWRDYAKTIFSNCHLDTSIHPVGWHNWDKPIAEMTTQYIEIDNLGPGAVDSRRATFSKQLKDMDKVYTSLIMPEKVLTGFNHWLKPLTATLDD